jgi:HEAT repeat protein
MVKEAARAAIETDPVSSAAAYEHADAATAVPSLIGLLGSEQRDAQYVAAYALGEFRTPEARQALQHYLKSDETTGGRRQAATIALARLGDRDALAAVREMVPKLGGRDLLEAARALDAARDPRALAILRQVLTGDHDLLRYEAAVLIGSRDADAVRRTLTTGLTSRNPWTRIAALTAFRRLGWDVPLEGRLLLADAAPHVAAAAVAAVSRRLAAPPPRAAAEPHGA